MSTATHFSVSASYLNMLAVDWTFVFWCCDTCSTENLCITNMFSSGSEAA